MTVSRVGISFEPELLDKFDKLIEEQGYGNRSEAVRDLVRKAIIESQIERERGLVIGTLTIIYDHHHGDVNNRLIDLQHHHHSHILATTHIHADHHTCLEVQIIKGEAKAVRALADNIRAVKGVSFGELVVTKTSI